MQENEMSFSFLERLKDYFFTKKHTSLSPDVDGLALDFFKCFSTFEFSLKAGGFLKGPINNKDNYNAEPNWHTFSVDERVITWFDDEWKKNPDFKKSVDYILSKPPHKQVVSDGKLKWITALPSDKRACVQIFEVYIPRIRNNLFHGGKYVSGDHGVFNWDDFSRTKELLQHSLVILYSAIDVIPEVSEVHNNSF